MIDGDTEQLVKICYEIPAHALTCASGRDGVELGSASRRNAAMRKRIICLARRADMRARLEREYRPGEEIGRQFQGEL